MGLKIWERYFYKQFISMFFLFLICFYGVYILIDYASHASAFSNHRVQIHWFEAVRYYVYLFASRAEVLLPIALVIAFVKTVCSLNSNQELAALMASGFKLKLLMRPFLSAGLFCLLILYANEQFLLPEALKKLRRIEDATKHQRSRHSLPLSVHHLVLEDGSLLIYQDYDPATERFFDVYWIESSDSVYRIKYLSAEANPIGYFVDHLKRQESGELLQQESIQEYSFPSLIFNPRLLQSTLFDPDILSLLELAKESVPLSGELNEKESKIKTAFYWKLFIPWLCLLAILAPAPFCTKFSRQLPIFFIYICSLFGLIAIYMFMDAAQVVAKRQVLSPFLAIGVPIITLFTFFGWRYYKLE